MEEPTYPYDSVMIFGLLIAAVFTASCIYAVGRMTHARLTRKPEPAELPADVIFFHQAVRLAGDVAKERFLREADTTVIVLPHLQDGSIAPPGPTTNPGADTVDVRQLQDGGRHQKQVVARAIGRYSMPTPEPA